FLSRFVTGSDLVLFLINDGLASFDDVLLVRKKLRSQFLWEIIEVALALQFLRRPDAEISRMSRIVQHEPPLFVLGVNKVGQMVNDGVQEVPLLRQPYVFLRKALVLLRQLRVQACGIRGVIRRPHWTLGLRNRRGFGQRQFIAVNRFHTQNLTLGSNWIVRRNK